LGINKLSILIFLQKYLDRIVNTTPQDGSSINLIQKNHTN